LKHQIQAASDAHRQHPQERLVRVEAGEVLEIALEREHERAEERRRKPQILNRRKALRKEQRRQQDRREGDEDVADAEVDQVIGAQAQVHEPCRQDDPDHRQRQ
jgi:hypothetical protein